ncbi:MAG: Na+/H+ antiporter NhaA [Sphingomonadales bacterium]
MSSPSARPGISPVLSRVFLDFFRSEKASGFILIGCTLLSIGLANSVWGPTYLHFWHSNVGGLTVEQWINDGLMAIFFLLVGLEIERELYIGELSKFRQAFLPVMAALGGMLLPALIHYLFNRNTLYVSGFGIPMATDIAFALGILSLAGKAVPAALKVFLAALAIIDDLGAILVIALFYTEHLSWIYLLVALGIFGVLFWAGKKGFAVLPVYLLAGIVMWYCMLRSGVHATISGVLLAFAIPFGSGGDRSISARLQHALHPLNAFFILPLFALANTGIALSADLSVMLLSLNSLGIMSGLVIGKPLGILLLCKLAISAGWAALPTGVNWKHIGAAGMLAGIGFTMSIFITLLAFADAQIVVSAKLAILVASTCAALLGLVAFKVIGSSAK